MILLCILLTIQMLITATRITYYEFTLHKSDTYHRNYDRDSIYFLIHISEATAAWLIYFNII